jgi:BTK motif
METEVKSRNEEAILMRETILKLETENKILERERIKLKQRNNKLKARRGVDKNFLLCKNCGKDY